MKTKLSLIAFFGLLTTGAPFAAASQTATRVEVNFFEPQNYADAKNESYDTDRGRGELLARLKEHIRLTAPRYLAQGQHLVINVTNVDLAGEFEPWQGAGFDHIRMVREIYPPRMTLEFRLLDAEGNVVSSGKRDLQELGYLMTLSLPTSDPLRYDKEMISDWMRREFRPSS